MIEIKPDNRVYFELPRMEVGQGVIDRVGMMVADHLDVPFENMDITALQGRAEAGRGADRPVVRTRARSLWDPVRIDLRPDAGPADGGRLAEAGRPGHRAPHRGRLRRRHRRPEALLRRAHRRGRRASRRPRRRCPRRPRSSRSSARANHGEDHAREIVTGHVCRTPWTCSRPRSSCRPSSPWPATHGASVVSIDDSEAKTIKGVIAVTHIPGMPDYLIPEAVAVTAETFGIAKKAKNALKIKWSAGPMDQHVGRPDRRHAQRDHRQGDLTGRGHRRHVPVALRPATPPWRRTPPSPTSGTDSAEVWGGSRSPTPPSGTSPRRSA